MTAPETHVQPMYARRKVERFGVNLEEVCSKQRIWNFREM